MRPSYAGNLLLVSKGIEHQKHRISCCFQALLQNNRRRAGSAKFMDFPYVEIPLEGRILAVADVHDALI
jgi:hypothetical protein